MNKETYVEIMSRKLHQLFPDEIERQLVLDVLHEYGTESHEREPERVRLDIVKLAGADMGEIDRLVKTAKQDYRDIIAWAEYPEEINASANKMTEAEVEELRGRDRSQYERWLFSS